MKFSCPSCRRPFTVIGTWRLLNRTGAHGKVYGCEPCKRRTGYAHEHTGRPDGMEQATYDRLIALGKARQ